MLHFFAEVQSAPPGVMQYFDQSNFAGQVIVVALMVFSLVAWTIMIGKFLDFKRMREGNFLLEKKLGQSHCAAGLELGKFKYTPYGVLLTESYESLQRCQEQGSTLDRTMQHIENALQRGVGAICVRYESKMVLLGSIITGAPLIGLLGTAWGVMDSFGAVALQASATIQMLAPGVSGALLTTVAALLVAIPSAFGYNYLLSQMKLMVTELENFASQLADRFEHELN